MDSMESFSRLNANTIMQSCQMLTAVVVATQIFELTAKIDMAAESKSIDSSTLVESKHIMSLSGM